MSEQENTKLLLMLEQIGKAVGAERRREPDVQVLVQATKPEALSRQIDEAVEDANPRQGSNGGASPIVSGEPNVETGIRITEPPSDTLTA